MWLLSSVTWSKPEAMSSALAWVWALPVKLSLAVVAEVLIKTGVKPAGAPVTAPSSTSPLSPLKTPPSRRKVMPLAIAPWLLVASMKVVLVGVI